MKYTLGPFGKQKELDFSLYPFANKGFTVNGILGGFKKFGILFSGGLDSTIVVCLLLRELEKIKKLEEVDITCFTFCKTSGSTYYADRMIKQIEKAFSKKIIHISNLENAFIHMTPTPLVFDSIVNLRDTYKDMLFFTGFTSYPDENEKVFEDTYKNNIPDSKLRASRVIQPLRELYKYHVVDLYYKLDVANLIPYTHTCTTQSIGTCNKCLGCLEREWAFDVLGKVDPKPFMPDSLEWSSDGNYKYSAGKVC